MSKKTIIILVVIVLLVIVGGIVWSMQGSSSTQTPVTTTQTTTTTTTTNPPENSILPVNANGHVSASKTDNFTIHADDTSADVTTIDAAIGDIVNITFVVNASTTYHGGLDFRSSLINSGTITPGASKTITFTAANSFSFTPYWPSTNIAKPYTISVVVK